MLETNARLIIEQKHDENPFIPLYTIVSEVLRDAISKCIVLPGERLKELEVAEIIGVSRSTVRRSFETLVMEGLALRRHSGGIEVAPMVKKSYLNITEIRAMLDSYSARLTAARRTKQDLAEMRKYIDMLSDDNIEQSSVADNEFHWTIYVATGNSYILRVYEEFNVEIIRSRYLTASGIASMLKRVRKEHIEIYDAIERQDIEGAAKAAMEHTRILLEPELIEVSELNETHKNKRRDITEL